jgi:hypothetical protein
MTKSSIKRLVEQGGGKVIGEIDDDKLSHVILGAQTWCVSPLPPLCERWIYSEFEALAASGRWLTFFPSFNRARQSNKYPDLTVKALIAANEENRTEADEDYNVRLFPFFSFFSLFFSSSSTLSPSSPHSPYLILPSYASSYAPAFFHLSLDSLPFPATFTDLSCSFSPFLPLPFPSTARLDPPRRVPAGVPQAAQEVEGAQV